jgi:RNA-directed DNA polymerase
LWALKNKLYKTKNLTIYIMPNDVPQPTYAQLTDLDTLRRAWQKVAAKRKAGGIDRQTVEGFADTAERDIDKLQTELIARRYVPEPYMEVKIPKKDNEMRSLGLLTIRDKVVQQALTDLLTPFIEPRFMDSSYAYRPGRGTQQAVRRVRHCIEHFWVCASMSKASGLTSINGMKCLKK